MVSVLVPVRFTCFSLYPFSLLVTNAKTTKTNKFTSRTRLTGFILKCIKFFLGYIGLLPGFPCLFFNFLSIGASTDMKNRCVNYQWIRETHTMHTKKANRPNECIVCIVTHISSKERKPTLASASACLKAILASFARPSLTS